MRTNPPSEEKVKTTNKKIPSTHTHERRNMTTKQDPREELHVVVGDVRVLGDELPPVSPEVFQQGVGVGGDLKLITGLPDL